MQALGRFTRGPARLVARSGSARLASRGLADAPSGDKGSGPSLHSSDIAFKPTEGGWGFNSKFESGYDRIFQKGGAAQATASPLVLSEQIASLEAALRCGALTREQHDQAAAGARERAK
ncbi:hypothetical protein T492DRAFT_942585 [Pavlovales sp. CCMP2436]|nr:hypothetical protein T492DRAFT_942585 [Pavlovales sp. CCMP2436]